MYLSVLIFANYHYGTINFLFANLINITLSVLISLLLLKSSCRSQFPHESNVLLGTLNDRAMMKSQSHANRFFLSHFRAAC